MVATEVIGTTIMEDAITIAAVEVTAMGAVIMMAGVAITDNPV